MQVQTISSMIIALLIPLVITIVLELIGMFIMGIRDKKDFLLSILINLITNPMINYFVLFGVSVLKGVLNELYGVNENVVYWTIVIILEIVVVLVEFIYYKTYLRSKKNPFILSLVLNMISFLGGLLCQGLLNL